MLQRPMCLVALVLLFAGCGSPERPPLISEPVDIKGAGAGPSLRDAGKELGAELAPRAIAVLAANQPRPSGLASDGTFLYFGNAGSNASDGTIQRIALGAHHDLSTLVTGLASPGAMLLRGDLFWLNEGNPRAPDANGSVQALTIGDGVRTLATREVAPAFLTADANNLYWTNGALGTGVSVSSAPLRGGRTSVLTTYPSVFSPGGVAVDKSFVYFLAHGEGIGALLRASIAGEAPEVLWQSDAGEPVDLVLDGTTLYWVVDDAPANGAVLAMPIDRTQPTTIARAQDHPVRLAVSKGSVYYLTRPPAGAGELLRVPTAGGTPELLATGLDQPRGLLVDAQIHVTTKDQILEIAK